jgi:hypothetical protein
MGELKMEKGVQGLLSGMMQGTPFAGLNLQPQMSQKDIIIELTPQQLKDSILSAPGSNLDARAKDAISIEFVPGKMIIRIRLF